MKKKIKISFFLPTLGAGGAERVMSFVSQNIDKNLFDATMVIIGKKSESDFETKNLKVVYLNKDRVLVSFSAIFSYIKKAKPDIAISAIGYLNIMMAFTSIFFAKTKFIGREVNVLTVLAKYSPPQKFTAKIVPFFTKVSYKWLDGIVCQSRDMQKDLNENFGLEKERLTVINNPITFNFTIKKTDEFQKKECFQFVTVGRLAKQKGHLRILEALSNLKIPFHYTIIGNGPEKERIFSTIRGYNMSDKVTHIAYTNKVPDFLAKSHIFLQGSYVEGFPNALLESCAVGTPVIAYDAPGGIDEIIEENVNGFIAKNVDEYINAINNIIGSLDKWNPNVVSESVYKKYNSEKILADYQELFLKLA